MTEKEFNTRCEWCGGQLSIHSVTFLSGPYIRADGWHYDLSSEDYVAKEVNVICDLCFTVSKIQTVDIKQPEKPKVNLVHKRIVSEIESFCIEKKVDCLLAVGAGSRVDGTNTKYSDYDVRLIYVRKDRESYITVFPGMQPVSIEEKRTVDVYDNGNIVDSITLDIAGWDISHALYLLSKGNAQVFEWNESPEKYIESEFSDTLSDIAPMFFNPITAAYHHASLAHNKIVDIDHNKQNEMLIDIKDYMAAAKHAINAVYVAETLGIPPSRPLDAVPSDNMKRIMTELIQMRADGVELMEFDGRISDGIRASISMARNMTENNKGVVLDKMKESVPGRKRALIDRLYTNMVLS